MMRIHIPAGESDKTMIEEHSSANPASLHALVEGHVQGVGFRYFVLARAQQLNLTGWVRNTPEGDVEVMAEGDRSELDDLLESLRKGPRSSFVSNVRENWEPPRGEFRLFDVRSYH
jgi:acylphosphatase